MAESRLLIALHSPDALLETGLGMDPPEKAEILTAFAVEQSVLCSPVCLGIISKYGQYSRISVQVERNFSCSSDCVAEGDLGAQARQSNQSGYRSFGLVHANISFGQVPAEKRTQLGKDCVTRLIASDSAESLADLFWNVAGCEEPALRLILEVAPTVDERGVRNIATLIEKAIPRLAFSSPGFARDLIRLFTAEQRERIVEAFSSQARHFSGGVFQGNPDNYMARRQKQFVDQVAALSDEVGLEDLVRALRRFAGADGAAAVRRFGAGHQMEISMVRLSWGGLSGGCPLQDYGGRIFHNSAQFQWHRIRREYFDSSNRWESIWDGSWWKF